MLILLQDSPSQSPTGRGPFGASNWRTLASASPSAPAVQSANRVPNPPAPTLPQAHLNVGAQAFKPGNFAPIPLTATPAPHLNVNAAPFQPAPGREFILASQHNSWTVRMDATIQNAYEEARSRRTNRYQGSASQFRREWWEGMHRGPAHVAYNMPLNMPPNQPPMPTAPTYVGTQHGSGLANAALNTSSNHVQNGGNQATPLGANGAGPAPVTNPTAPHAQHNNVAPATSSPHNQTGAAGTSHVTNPQVSSSSERTDTASGISSQPDQTGAATSSQHVTNDLAGLGSWAGLNPPRPAGEVHASENAGKTITSREPYASFAPVQPTALRVSQSLPSSPGSSSSSSSPPSSAGSSPPSSLPEDDSDETLARFIGNDLVTAINDVANQDIPSRRRYEQTFSGPILPTTALGSHPPSSPSWHSNDTTLVNSGDPLTNIVPPTAQHSNYCQCSDCCWRRLRGLQKYHKPAHTSNSFHARFAEVMYAKHQSFFPDSYGSPSKAGPSPVYSASPSLPELAHREFFSCLGGDVKFPRPIRMSLDEYVARWHFQLENIPKIMKAVESARKFFGSLDLPHANLFHGSITLELYERDPSLTFAARTSTFFTRVSAPTKVESTRYHIGVVEIEAPNVLCKNRHKVSHYGTQFPVKFDDTCASFLKDWLEKEVAKQAADQRALRQMWGEVAPAPEVTNGLAQHGLPRGLPQNIRRGMLPSFPDPSENR